MQEGIELGISHYFPLDYEGFKLNDIIREMCVVYNTGRVVMATLFLE